MFQPCVFHYDNTSDNFQKKVFSKYRDTTETQTVNNSESY